MSNRVNDAVALLRGRFNKDIAILVQRDGAFLSSVCGGLGLDGSNLVHRAHVATILAAMQVPTGEEYPKHVPINDEGMFKIANNEEEEKKILASLMPKEPHPEQKRVVGATDNGKPIMEGDSL